MFLWDIIVVKEWKMYLSVLFDGALPVFVGATISRAVVSFVRAIAGSSNLPVIISLHFIYALFFGYGIGVLVINKLKSDSTLYDYVHRLTIENASFAFKEFVTLIILEEIFTHDNYGPVFGALFLLVLILFSIVYFANF